MGQIDGRKNNTLPGLQRHGCGREFCGSGRRRPVPIKGSEQVVPLDTLIVAISEKPELDWIEATGLTRNSWGGINIDTNTYATDRAGVFAGGDVVTGPNTVVEALAAGKKVAVSIDRYHQHR